MRNRRHSASPIERLRIAIDCLPVKTREAMLAGVRANDRIIIMGARDDTLSSFAREILASLQT